MRNKDRGSKPLKIDLRYSDMCAFVKEQATCAANEPFDEDAPKGSIFSSTLAEHRNRIDEAWQRVHGSLTSLLPNRPSKVTIAHIISLINLIDKEFWSSTLVSKSQKRGWRLSARVQNHSVHLGEMRRADYPLANVTVHRQNKTVEITAQTHLSYYPRYPHRCDGVKVANWKQHLAHVIAHELVHVARIVFCAREGNNMYPQSFDDLNSWVYSHTSHFDTDASDEDPEINVDLT